MQNNKMPQFGASDQPNRSAAQSATVGSGDPFGNNTSRGSSFNGGLFSSGGSGSFGNSAFQNSNSTFRNSNNVFEDSNNTFRDSNSAFRTGSNNSSQYQNSPSARQKSPKQKTPTSINTKLAILSVILGVIALIAIVISVWLLINRNSDKELAPAAPTTTVASDPDSVSAKTFGFYTNKITNPASDAVYQLGTHRTTENGNAVLGAYINTTTFAVDIYIYWNYVSAFYGVPTGRVDRELSTITFNQSVVDITIGESGENVSGDVLLFLLADGTVEYMPIARALESSDFRSYGQLAGIQNVVKFYHAEVSSTNSSFSGYATALVQRDNGSIIDLQDFLRSALNGETAETI